VLEEPQQRVGDDVVRRVVDAAIDGREAQPQPVAASIRFGSAATRRSPSLIAAATHVTGT
jgi:hypothetical protein